MDFFKTWIVPPLVGAVIGYFTNWLAIKMLFRPLEPVYLGRFKLPFTPGILPAERERLSASVGDTVSTELLSAEVFRARLADPDLLSKIEEATVSILASWLERPASPALRGLGKAPAAEGLEPGAVVSASLTGLLESAEFRGALVEASRRAAEELAGARLGELLSPGRLKAFAADYVRKLGEEEGQAKVEGLADGIAGLLGGAAGSLFSSSALEPLAALAARSLYSGLIPVVEEYLGSPETAAELERSGMTVVRGVIGRLTPIQRLIVGAANYERTLEETMPQTVADLTRSAMALLKKPETEARLLKAVLELLAGGGEGGLASGFIPLEEAKPALRAFLARTAAEGGDFSERLAARYETLASKTIGELVPGLPSALEARTRDFLLPSSLGKAALGRGVSAFLAAYADALEGRSLGQALGLGEAELRSLSAAASRGVVAALSSQAGRLVEALDVKSMVVDKLNSLEMLEVEKLILKVVDKELAWITILGGILGAVIGVFQSLISLL